MTISLDAREPELMPCPFCGGRMLFRAALWPSDGDCDGFIHAEPTECPLGNFSDSSSDRSIIGKWNARAAIAAVREGEGEGEGTHSDNLKHFVEHIAALHKDGFPNEAESVVEANEHRAAEAMRARCEAKLREMSADADKNCISFVLVGRKTQAGEAYERGADAIAALKDNGERK